MDTKTLVTEDIEAGAEFLRRLDAYRPVKVACWLRVDDDRLRYLTVALEGLTTENSRVAYHEVLRITQEMKDHYIDPFRVDLIGTDDPIAKSVMEIYKRYPGPMPTRFDGQIIGRTEVAEAYLYTKFAPKA